MANGSSDNDVDDDPVAHCSAKWQQAPSHQNTLALQKHLSPRLSAMSAPGHLSLSMKGKRDLGGSDHINCAKDLKIVHNVKHEAHVLKQVNF